MIDSGESPATIRIDDTLSDRAEARAVEHTAALVPLLHAMPRHFERDGQVGERFFVFGRPESALVWVRRFSDARGAASDAPVAAVGTRLRRDSRGVYAACAERNRWPHRRG